MVAPQKSYPVRGIVLDTTKVFEQDLIVTLLITSGEKAQAIAKGARKPGAKLCAMTDYFCELDALLSYGRGSLPYLKEARLLDAHQTIRQDLDKLSAAAALIEVAKHTSFEEAPDPFCFPILHKALACCDKAQTLVQLNLLVSAYIFKILAHLGYRPVTDCCVSCGEPDIEYFSCVQGGALCSMCASEYEEGDLVDATSIEWIQALLQATFDEVLDFDTDEAFSLWLVRVAHRWAATHLDCRLKALEFMAGV